MPVLKWSDVPPWPRPGERFCAERFDAVVLGALTDTAARKALVHQLKCSKPGVPVLALYRPGDPPDSYNQADETLESPAVPQALIAVLAGLVGHPPGSVTAGRPPAANAGD